MTQKLRALLEEHAGLVVGGAGSNSESRHRDGASEKDQSGMSKEEACPEAGRRLPPKLLFGWNEDEQRAAHRRVLGFFIYQSLTPSWKLVKSNPLQVSPSPTHLLSLLFSSFDSH